MLRILLTPRWLGGLAIALVFAVVAVWLGFWQFDKHTYRVEQRDQIEANYGATPIPLGDVLAEIDSAGSLPAERGWTRVRFTGEYASDEQLFVRNRPYRGNFGYHLAAPAAMQPGGQAILVDRGWVAYGDDAATLPEVDRLPSGEVTITGWLRPSEPGYDRTLPQGQLTSLNAGEAAAQSGVDLVPAYLLLESETTSDGSTPARPQAPDPPDTDLRSHLAYALQWWIASPIGLALVWVFIRRERNDAALIAQGKDPRTERVRTKKHRIWDDEDE